ncbi:MAG: hypothetical protein AB8H80_05955 [Planctomycetota bacterium]
MTPTMLLAVSAIILLGLGIRDVGRVSAEARRLQACTLLARARIAADTAIRSAAAAPVHSAAAGTSVEVRLADIAIRLERTPSGVRAHPSDLEGVGSFFAPWLDGAAAPCFSQPRSSIERPAGRNPSGSTTAWKLSPPGEWPRWHEPELARAKRADQRSGFRRDQSIALEHFAAGSDLEDYIWERCEDALPAVGAAGLLVVPGHLWILKRMFPAGLSMQLERDLVIVVEGNLYLGASVRVSGPGRLLIAARASGDATVFADLDGSGAWSRGDRRDCGNPALGACMPTPVEGCGAVWLGLAASEEALVCDAGIYADGAVHLKTSCTVRGPLLAAGGAVVLATADTLPDLRPELLPAGQSGWAFDPGRDRIPGFKVRGRPRPGRLVFQER